jgi:hypothetical protein
MRLATRGSAIDGRFEKVGIVSTLATVFEDAIEPANLASPRENGAGSS